MTREQAREEFNSRPELVLSLLEKSKGGKQYNCPYCSSGAGRNGTGALTYYPDTHSFYCFACVTNNPGEGFALKQDVLGAYRLINECSETEAFSQVGIVIDEYSTQNATRNAQSDFSEGKRVNTPPATEAAKTASQELTEATDHTAYYRECKERLQRSPEAISYLQARGISLDTALQYWIGFDPKADPAQSNHPTARIIFPTCSTHYVARAIDPNTPGNFAKMNNKGGKPAIFNAKVLKDSSTETIFVTEGGFDALSIIEVGAAAIALNSTSNANKLIDLLRQERTAATLVLCLDNDKAGQNCTKIIKEGLQRLNISYVTADICGGYKDPNEHLQANRDSFTAAVQEAERQTAARPDNISYYIDAIMSREISELREGRIESTGFKNFDEQTGGLYAGLYVIAAGSSIGKTTFCTQLADQLATAGNDVLFFSMEQSRLEIVSKSLARRTAQEDIATAANSLQIRQWHFKRNDPDQKQERVLKAADAYKKDIGERLSIIEGNFDCNCSLIGDKIRNYVKRTGTKPVVFVDYLQILQPEKDERGRTQTTKETIDNVVTELKRISRELKLTVIVISSINRAAYYTDFSMESLKESGNVEFTADFIAGLQLQCMNDKIFNSPPTADLGKKKKIIEAAKAESPRKLELKCVKNRYGIATFKLYYNYYPSHDLFTEGTYCYTEAEEPKKAGRKLQDLEEIPIGSGATEIKRRLKK
jgi:replicative DNA helicase